MRKSAEMGLSLPMTVMVNLPQTTRDSTNEGVPGASDYYTPKQNRKKKCNAIVGNRLNSPRKPHARTHTQKNKRLAGLYTFIDNDTSSQLKTNN